MGNILFLSFFLCLCVKKMHNFTLITGKPYSALFDIHCSQTALMWIGPRDQLICGNYTNISICPLYLVFLLSLAAWHLSLELLACFPSSYFFLDLGGSTPDIVSI